jgi:inosose dehydratase
MVTTSAKDRLETERVGNAPCSWGTIEDSISEAGGGGGSERVPYGRMLDELVATGYRGTELGDYGFMPTDPERLRAELEERGLTMLGAFEGVNLVDPAEHLPGRERVLRNARLLAGVADLGDPGWRPMLVLADDNGRDPERFAKAGRVTPEMSLSGEGWRTFARGAEEIARAVHGETGLATVFHPHCAGFVETPREIEALLELTTPEALQLVFDTGHFLYGTGSNDAAQVLGALERYRERIAYVHFKDCDPEVATRAREQGWDYRRAVAEGVFCELGQGSVDFAAVLDKLRELGYDGWITVEQDVLPGMGSPRESARRNREYLRSIGL